jgi:DNA-binding IclR family transcriptional regulator
MGNSQEQGITKKKESYQVQAVDRALEVLSCFSLTNTELTLAEICELSGLPKPTVFRLLASLEAAKFVELTSDKQRYTVGIRLFELGQIYQSNLSIEHVVTPFMQEITRKHDIVCNLGILDEGQVVYIASTDPGGPFRHVPIIGYRHYVHCSALGKSLLIEHENGQIEEILDERGMPPLSPHTLTEPDAFLDDLEQARQQGYTVDDQEGAVGIFCLAVPIRNRKGQVVAALSVSGPSPKFDFEMKDQILEDLRAAASSVRPLL